MINSYVLKKVKIKDILLDPENPNRMTDKQLMSLRYSLRKFGQLKPPIIDQTMTVCDGEQQIRAYVAEGTDEIQVIQVVCTPAERRLIRQTMNKLHGEHNHELDINEYMELLKENQLKELAMLISQNEKDLIDSIGQSQKEQMSYQKDDIVPYKKTHVLLSFHPDMISIIKPYLDEILKQQGVECEQSSN